MKFIDVGKVRVGVSSARVTGRDYVDIRAYKTDHAGLLKPTSTGLLIPVDCFEAVMAAGLHECEEIKKLDPAPIYYFKESVEDKSEIRTVAAWTVSSLAKQAVAKTPEEYGAEENKGYIFKCTEYEIVNSASYKCAPTKPYAVWNATHNKWVKWEKRDTLKNKPVSKPEAKPVEAKPVEAKAKPQPTRQELEKEVQVRLDDVPIQKGGKVAKLTTPVIRAIVRTR